MSCVASASVDQPMPVTRVPRELSEWSQACHEELGQALVTGNETRVMELSSRLSDGAAKMSELMGVMVRWSWLVGRTVRTWGYRGVRVGEASHPGPRLLRRYPRARGGAPTVVDSDEEPLLHASDTIVVSQLSTLPASHGGRQGVSAIDRGGVGGVRSRGNSRQCG